MSEPFLGEIRIFPFSWAPEGWAKCDGQVLSISENTALFALLQTTYGGDGRTNFALPDLRSRIPTHRGNSTPLGAMGGTEAVQLTIPQLGAHTHTMGANPSDGATQIATGGVWANNPGAYANTADTTLSAQALSNAGGHEAHPNVQPTAVANYCIATEGQFPSRN